MNLKRHPEVVVISLDVNIKRQEWDFAPFANVILFNKGIYVPYATKSLGTNHTTIKQIHGQWCGVQCFKVELCCLTWLVGRYEQVPRV